MGTIRIESVNGKVRVLPIGTKAWLKNINDEICQVRYLGAVSVNETEEHIGMWHMYEVATKNGIIHVITPKLRSISNTGNGTSQDEARTLTGVIYMDYEEAQNNTPHIVMTSSKRDRLYDMVQTIDLKGKIMEKYGISERNIHCDGATLRVCGYVLNSDNTIHMLDGMAVNVLFAQHGCDVSIPLIDGGRVYPTMEEAKRHIRKLPTFTLDDVENNHETVEVITIKLTKTDKAKLEKLGII